MSRGILEPFTLLYHTGGILRQITAQALPDFTGLLQRFRSMAEQRNGQGRPQRAVQKSLRCALPGLAEAYDSQKGRVPARKEALPFRQVCVCGA